MQLGTATPDEVRNVLLLSKHNSQINSHFLFESVRAEVRRLLNDKTIFLPEDPSILQIKRNAWFFDRIFNGPWQYTDPKDIDQGLSKIIVPPPRTQKLIITPNVPTRSLFGRITDTLLRDVDGSLFSDAISSISGGGSYIDDDRAQDNDQMLDTDIFKKLGVNKNVINDWAPIIAIYGRSKQILLANPAYTLAMHTDLDELEDLICKGKFQDLIAQEYHPKLHELITKLSTGGSYKNEMLRAARTDRDVSWNSEGDPESGSLRIGKDVTHGENNAKLSKGMSGFRLHGEEMVAKFRQEVLGRIDAIDQRGFDAEQRGEFTTQRILIDTKLRVLLTCGSALDVFWKGGPFFMNIIVGDQIYGNENYANLAGISGKTSLDTLYSSEQRALIEQKFAEGRRNGHYESEFTMRQQSGEAVVLSWHRYFPDLKKADIGENLSFAIGTNAITDRQHANRANIRR